MIVIKDSVRVDGGIYTLQLTNEAGSETVPFKVVVLDRPCPCEGPLQITGVAEDRCTLVWRAPLHDGGSPVTHYIIERRETSRLAWTVVSNNCDTTCHRVTKLLEGNEYMFRVMAVNSHGVSEPLESAGVIMKTPFVLPGPPHIQDISNITHDGMTITWSAPESDGGSEITNYIIEKKDRSGIKWTRCNRQKVTDLCFRVTSLSTGHEYEFRVAAENVVGVGEPSLPSSYYKASDPKYKPGAPAYVNVIDSTKSSITVSWGKPLFDGGSTIQGYIVEACKAEEEEWTMVTPPTGLRVNKYEISKLTEGQEYKIQVCAVNKKGVGEPAVLSGTAKPEERMEPPQIHLTSELRKGIVMKAGGSVRIYIPFKGRPTPEIKWTKDEGDLTEKAVVEKALNFTQLSIDSCDRSDSGKYTLTLTNSSGSVSEFVSVKVLDTPGAPQNLVVKDVKKDSVTLVWDAPLIDGGSKIKNYVIDKRESTRKAYANVSTKCNKTTFKVENLIEGALYYFRVMAENDYGIGQAVETKTASKASEVPLPVEKVFLTDVTKASASLAWEKPEHDGGSRIGGYLIEMQPKGTDKWGVAANTKTCEGTVSGLTPGKEYLFRIIAYNEKGKSEPKVLAAPVIASDMTMAPSIKMQFSTYTVLAGKDLKLEFPLFGRPKPKVTWAKDGETLKVTSRVNRAAIDTTSSYTMLVIDNVNRFDSGKYSLTLENSSGTKSFMVAVRILDTPSAPQNFAVTEIKKDSVTLAWETPLTDGGSKITNYIVEKRESVRKAYTTVTSNCTANSFKIEELPEGGIFYFRVCAVNEYGQGQMVETKEIKVAEVPLPPSKVTLVDVTKTSVSLTWEKPAHDGGSKVMCYSVEYKPKTGGKWGTACTVKVPEATIPNLTPNETYLFRVAAINEKGKSEPKDLGLPVVAKDVAVEPSVSLLFTTYSVKAGEDLTLEVPIRGRPKPVVSWKKDGLPLKQTSSVTILNTAISSKIIIKEASKEHVGKYEITLSNTAGTVTADIGVAVKVDAVTSDSITLSWSPPDYDGGCCISNYIMEKRDTNTQEWQMIASNVARTCFKAGRLTHGATYQFRIYAVNRYGKSTHLDSPAVTAQYTFKQPGPPSTPIVQLATKSYMLVTWNEPVSDGGSPVLGYHLERKERSSILWTKMNRGMIKDTEYKVSGIEEGMMYEYRVYAENIAGIGKCSKSCEAVADPQQDLFRFQVSLLRNVPCHGVLHRRMVVLTSHIMLLRSVKPAA
uniref:Titin n=1 Tax=Mastacembelus armatus TaxID=205130 RepID=A0A7N8XU64_9TELE